MNTAKKPRDFVHIDEFWEADEHWHHYFIEKKIWIFADEYHADLIGDEDYSRIIIHTSASKGWLYTRSLKEKQMVFETLTAINKPVSEKQLKQLGFIEWYENYI